MKRFIKIQHIISLLMILLFSTHLAEAQSTKKPVGVLLYRIIETNGVEAAIERYRTLKKNGSRQYDLSQNQLNKLGYRLLNEGKAKDAVAIFKLNAETYPQSINVWDSLAEGYLAIGDHNRAAENYRKTLNMLKADTSLTPRQKNFLKNNVATKLLEAEHFDPSSTETLQYASFYGGLQAGKWDMQNAVEFKKKSDTKISYDGTNLYFSPVPGNVEESLKDADVTTGFVMGDYRRMIDKGLIADISNLWEEEGWDHVFPGPFKKIATYEDKQYFVPMAYQWNPIWYRKDIFEKHNLTPPQSWEELLELCDRLNELEYTPFTIGVQNWPPPVARWFTTLNLRLNGPEFHRQVMKGKVPYTDDRIRNVFVHWRELFRNDAFADSSFSNNYQAGIQAFTSGNAVMYNLGEWLFESPPVRKIEEKLDFFAFPEMNPDVISAEIVHTYGAFMTMNNSNPEKSEALLKWLAGAASQQSNVEANSRIVANREVDQSLYSDVQKRIITYINNTEVLVPLFEMNTHPDPAQKALGIFQEYWKHTEDIDTALKKLEEARTRAFEDGK